MAIYQLWHVIVAAVVSGVVFANLGVVLGGVLATSKIAGLEIRIAELEQLVASFAAITPARVAGGGHAYVGMDATHR